MTSPISLQYGEAFTALITSSEPSPLGPGNPNSHAQESLSQLTMETAFRDFRVADTDMGNCCIAAVWLLHNYLDESHTIAQGIKTSTGSYWHGIMHRREPDAQNSAYWFRKVGSHGLFPDLCSAASETASQKTTTDLSDFLKDQSTWDPAKFIEFADSARGGNTSQGDIELCIEIQQLEWNLLFDFCYKKSIGEV